MKYTRSQFTHEYYLLWQMGLIPAAPKNASTFSVKFRITQFDDYSRVTFKASSVSDALERACYFVTATSPWKPEDVDLHAVYDAEENLLWIDEPFYEIVQNKHEFRGMDRRQFIMKFGTTSAAILYGLQPEKAQAIIPFAFFKRKPAPAGPTGSALYTTSSSYTWTVPASVTSVSVVCIGGGGGGNGNGGGGGGVQWINTYLTTPGGIINVVVGAGGIYSTTTNGVASTFAGTVIANGGTNGNTAGTPTENRGGSGGTGSGGSGGGTGGKGGGGFSNNGYYGGGGGAAGYTGNGGIGGNGSASGLGSSGAAGIDNLGNTGAGGGGGGGSGGSNGWGGASGGGVGLYGLTITGAGGIAVLNSTGGGGGGGSGGTTPISGYDHGGVYGGGGGGYAGNKGNGGSGAVRIIWGSGRSFPSNAS